jgi:hypothetical protein
MWLLHELSAPVVLVIFIGLVVVIASYEKLAALKAAIKGVPPEKRAEIIRALGTMYRHDPRALIPGIRRKELSGKDPDDSGE